MKAWQPDAALDILVCGWSIDRIGGPRPYGSLRGNATRAFGLANNLALQGRSVGLVVESDCRVDASASIAAELQLVPRPRVAEAASRARVLLLACTNLKTMRQRAPVGVLLDHPRKWAACCFDMNDGEDMLELTRGVTGICFNNDGQARSWKARGLTMPTHVQPYGVDEHLYYDAAIRPAERPTALWIGILRLPSLLERIVRFAEINPECEVRVVSGLVFDQQKPAGSPGSFDRPYIDAQGGPVSEALFDEIVLRWCGRPSPPNMRFLGPCPGQNAELIGAASLALGFSRRTGQAHDDSKILEYLRGGVPVLCDDGQPAHRFVTKLGHGYVMPFGAGDEALREGFQHCRELTSLDRRRGIAARVRDRYGWPAVARKVAHWIDDDAPTLPIRAQAAAAQPLRSSSSASVQHSLRLLYIPWIAGHTGSLVKLLHAGGSVEFVPLDLGELFPGRPGVHRFEITTLARNDAPLFGRLLAELVARTRTPVNAVLGTADWNPGLRHAIQAFRAAGFPTAVVPHESVFAQEHLYYRDPQTGADTPEAELALLWGGLQEDIFRRRGLPPERMKVVGSPKLDFVRHYRSEVSRQDFYARWTLPSDRPVILFATQPLDLQFDTQGALAAQSRAVSDCLALAGQHQCRLIVRLPPARGAEILEPSVRDELRDSDLAALDGAAEGEYLATPHDALFHADVVVSINSTMLLEGSLMRRPAISIGYTSCDQLWHKQGGLPLVTDRDQFSHALQRALKERRSLFTSDGWDWIRWAFSPGTFDGASAVRILDSIRERWPERALPAVAF